ncbi:unnamed protein product [Peronospora farinosa]|uniref:Uncharacterized protein n=1 Tax=Peronospora farinosa TaxID=134698 RepID=A0ABN8BVW7_9STRA|nr:unnamed protein product [Peronospora farinosa]
MRSIVAVYGLLTASFQSAIGFTVVHSGCEGLEEQSVRVVGVVGIFCVPLRPCEGSVNSGTNEPLACPREGQRDVFGEVELMTDSCCAVVDSVSGALGCVLAGAEERKSVCLPSANWRRERDSFRLSRRRKRMQNVADSLSPAGSTGVTPAPVIETDPSVATTTPLAAATTPVAMTTLIPMAMTTLTPVEYSATEASATPVVSSSVPVNSPSVPVNSSSGPVASTSAPFATATTVAVHVPSSVVPVSTAKTEISTIDTAASDTLSESSSSSGSGPTYSPFVVIPTPLTPTPLCTMGSDCNDNGGLVLEVSSADTSGPGSAADGSLRPPTPTSVPRSAADGSLRPPTPTSVPGSAADGSLRPPTPTSVPGSAADGLLRPPTPTSVPAADVEISESAGSLTGSTSLSNGSIPIGTMGNSSEMRSTSTGSVATLIDEGTGASLNVSLASSPETASSNSSSNLGSDEPSDSGSIAVNSVKNGSLDNLSNSNAESSTKDNVVPKPSLSRSSSSILAPASHSLEIERLTPVPIVSPWSKGVLQLSPITDDDNENSVNPPPSTDGGLPPVNGIHTDESNALGLNVILFITVGSVVAVALIFGVFYLRPKRAITHELLTPEPPRPMDRTGAYPYDHSLELESTGPYDASNTPRGSI